jgi:holo-[acyl-carrier protein] synthase
MRTTKPSDTSVPGPSTPNTPQQSLISRWVLKEAAYKALSAHISTGLTWKSLEVDHLPSGQPTIRYSPSDTTVGRSPGLVGMEVDLMCTLSHDAGVVVGVVIAQTKG